MALLWYDPDEKPTLSYNAKMTMAVLSAQFAVGLATGFMLGWWLT